MSDLTHATIIGLQAGQLIWTCDFTASRGSKGEWTGSESFYVNITDTTNFLPVNGAGCEFPGFAFLKVQGCKVENYEGNICKVTVIYGGNDSVDSGGGSDDDPGNGVYSTELVIQTSDEPIETHVKYAKEGSGLSSEEKFIIQNYKSGKFIPSSINDPNPNTADKYKFNDVNNHIKSNFWEITSDKGKELVDFLANGVDTYRIARQIWRVTYTSNKMVPASWLNQVGLISNPLGGAPAVSDGRNWLFQGCNISTSGSGDGVVYTIALEWVLSGLGGWTTKLYDKTNFNL